MEWMGVILLQIQNEDIVMLFRWLSRCYLITFNLFQANTSFISNYCQANVSLESKQPWENVSFKTQLFSNTIAQSYPKLSWQLMQLMYISIEGKCYSCVTNVDLNNNVKCFRLDTFVVNNSDGGQVKNHLLSLCDKVWKTHSVHGNISGGQVFN